MLLAVLLISGGLGALGCAKGNSGVPDGDGGGDDIIDSGGPGAVDAPPAGASDAPPGTPDAPPAATPDATPGTPDAAPPSCTPCELVSQCGCGPTQACDLDSSMFMTGGTTCRAMLVAGMENNTCASNSACAAGYTCVGGAGASACREYCSADTSCTGPGGLCTIQLTYGMAGTPIPGAKVCSPNCDPLQTAPTGCPPSWGCHVYYNMDEARNFTWCTPTGASGQGVACTSDANCQAGYGCVNNGTGTFCLKNCNLTTGGGGCPGVTTCIGFDPAAIIGTTEYGVCN